MGCKTCEAANGRSPSQRAQRRRPPGKPEPIRVATKSRARGVALLGIVVSATTFVALLAIIAILSATRLMEDLIRGSLRLSGDLSRVECSDPHHFFTEFFGYRCAQPNLREPINICRFGWMPMRVRRSSRKSCSARRSGG